MTDQFATLFDAARARTEPILIWRSAADIEHVEFPTVWESVHAVAAQFQSAGVQRGHIVVLALPTSFGLLLCLLAAWACRAAVAIVPPELIESQGTGKRLNHLSETLTLLSPTVIVHNARTVAESASGCSATLISSIDLAFNGPVRDWDLHPPSLEDLAIIQLTSGSTGAPKGVPLSHRMMAINCADLKARVQLSPSDILASWLPLNHDMGLSALSMAVSSQMKLVLSPTETFGRAPLSWLECLSTQHATLTFAPAFAYALVAKFARRINTLPLNLSALRYACVGAEPVFLKQVQRFQEVLTPHGLRNHVVRPAYGMAEAVVAVTTHDPRAPVNVLSVAAHEFRRTGKVESSLPDDYQSTIDFLSNGRPLDHVDLRVVNSSGGEVAEGVEGEILLAGPTITTGYLRGADGDRFDGRWYRTGDLGFVWAGEVYITGRKKDQIIRGGVNLSAQEIEWVAAEALNLRQDQVAAFAHIDHRRGHELLVIVIGKAYPLAKQNAARLSVSLAVRESLRAQVDQVMFTHGRNLLKTTSGKLRRAAIREFWLSGEWNEFGDHEHIEPDESIC